MVKLNKIYTRTGDKGMTSLVGGVPRSKYDLRVVAFGSVDEANGTIGLARMHTQGEPDAALARIQQDLFDLGADLATPPEGDYEGALRIIDKQVVRLENEIDAMNEHIAPLNSFILPGGSPASAYLHLARTIVRRAEREMFELAQKEPVGEPALQYINRLSDHLFVMARALNDNGKADVLWVPGLNR